MDEDFSDIVIIITIMIISIKEQNWRDSTCKLPLKTIWLQHASLCLFGTTSSQDPCLLLHFSSSPTPMLSLSCLHHLYRHHQTPSSSFRERERERERDIITISSPWLVSISAHLFPFFFLSFFRSSDEAETWPAPSFHLLIPPFFFLVRNIIII